MNKTNLINKISQKLDGKFTKIDISTILDATIDSIIEGVKEDGAVQLVGFGSFVAKKRAERVGHHPRTGEILNIPASTSVSFKVGKTFKEAIK